VNDLVDISAKCRCTVRELIPVAHRLEAAGLLEQEH
jgi:hypothetical protein